MCDDGLASQSRPQGAGAGAGAQKNCAVVRTVVGYHRYDTGAGLLLLNKIWVLQSQMTNYFLAQQKLLSKVRDGAKITKKYDAATTPHRRAEHHEQVSTQDKAIMNRTLSSSTQLRSSGRSRPSPPSCSPSRPARPQPRSSPRFRSLLRAHRPMSQRPPLRAHLDVSHQGAASFGQARRAASSSSTASRSGALTTASQCESAAAIPPTSGR